MAKLNPSSFIDKLVSKGVPAIAAAGIAGNVSAESNFDSGIAEVNPQTESARKQGGGFGFFQHTGTRREALNSHAASRGTTPDNPDTQIEFALQELDTTHKHIKEKLFNAKSPAEAAKIWSDGFEVPSPKYARNDVRMNNAEAYYSGKDPSHDGLGGIPHYTMPGVKQQNTLAHKAALAQAEEDQAVDPVSWADTYQAMSQQNSLTSSLVSMVNSHIQGDDPNYVPPQRVDLEKTFAEQGLPRSSIPRILDARSKREEDIIYQRLHEDKSSLETLRNSGWVNMLSAGILADFSDPINAGINLAGFGVGAAAAKGRAAYMLAQAGIQGGTNAAQEAALYGMHETRPAEQILEAGVFGALFGTVGGAAIYRDTHVSAVVNKAVHSLRDDHNLMKAYDLALEKGDTEAADVILSKVTPSNQELFKSGGAAHNPNYQVDRTEIIKSIEDRMKYAASGEIPSDLIDKVDLTNLSKPIGKTVEALDQSLGGYLTASPSPTARQIATLLDNGVGVDAKGMSLGHSAESQARLLKHTSEADWLMPINDAFSRFDARAASKVGSKLERRKAFMEHVADLRIAGKSSDDPDIQQALRATHEFFTRYEQEGKLAGLFNEDTVNQSGNYVPQLLDMESIRAVHARGGDKDMEELLEGSLTRRYQKDGNQEFYQAYLKSEMEDAKGILDAATATRKAVDPENAKALGKAQRAFAKAEKAYIKAEQNYRLQPERAKRFIKALAKGYTRNVIQRGETPNFGKMVKGANLSDKMMLREILEKSGLPEGEIDDILNSMTIKPPTGGAARTKRRVEFDMEYGTDKLHMRDLFHRDLDYIVPQYANQMAGRIAIGKTLGVTTDSEFESLIQKMSQELADAGMHGNKGQSQHIKKARAAYKNLTGNSLLEDPSSSAVKAVQLAKDYTFLAVGAGFSAAQVVEFGNVMATIGLPAMLKQVPAMDQLIKMARGQKLDSGLARTLQAATAAGTNALRNKVFTGIGMGNEVLSGSADRFMHSAKNFVADASGMTSLMSIQQHMVASGYAQNMVDVARKAKGDITKLPRGIVREWKSLGLQTDAQFQRLLDNLNDPQKTLVGSGWGKLHDLDTGKWDNSAFNDLSLMLNKMAGRAVQENSLGTSYLWQHTSLLGVAMSQFRNFSINAIAKQTLQGVSQRDISIGAKFALSLFIGSLSYTLRTYANHHNKDDFAERMTPERIATGGLNLVGGLSVLPTLVDAAAGLSLQHGVFNHGKTSGLSGYLPAPIAIGGAVLHTAAAGANAALRSDYSFSKSDAKAAFRALPLHTFPGVESVVDTWIKDLPKHSTTRTSPLIDTANNAAGNWGFSN